MLDAVEQGAKANTAQGTAAVQALSGAVDALNVHSSRIEDLVAVRMQVERLQGEVKELQDESKGEKVGKSDLLWKVLVGVFGAVSTALGVALLGMLLKGGV